MQVGEVLAGRYRIDRVLGSGGMSVVVAATDQQTDQVIALKFITPERRESAEAAARVLREANAATRLRGRHVNRLLDVVRTATDEPVLVMELLDGEDLARMIAREGSISERTATGLMLEACEGLAEAHALGLVHRDIKPSNLFLARDVDGTDVVKVIDFGVVKNGGIDDETQLTRTTSMVGSVAYMAPEQLRKLAVDARADVWAIGVVLYELVSGTRPFPAETITDASIRIAVEPPVPLPSTASATLVGIIMRCLEKDPDDRFQDVGELAHALASTVGGAAIERAERIRRVLGALPRVERKRTPPAAQLRRSLGVRVRDVVANHSMLIALGVGLAGLSLWLGSFAVDDKLNEFTIGAKRTGYASSFNWTLVHTFLSPITIAVLGALVAAVGRFVASLGSAAVVAWDRRARRILVLWVVLSLLFGLGYTATEWRAVVRGECDGGTFLGWPNQLCHQTRSTASIVFMIIAAGVQTIVLCTGWFLLSTVIWISELFFGRGRLTLDPRGHDRVGAIFGLAAWAWFILFANLYLARLWSFHLRTPGTEGLGSTIFTGSVFAVDAHTQTDWGAIFSGVTMLVAAVTPLVLLRARTRSTSPALITTQRAVAVFCGAGATAMVFPRLGFFLLPITATVGMLLPRVRHALLAAWGQRLQLD